MSSSSALLMVGIKTAVLYGVPSSLRRTGTLADCSPMNDATLRLIRNQGRKRPLHASLSSDAVGGVDDLLFTGVRDGHVNGASAAAQIGAGLDDGHGVTDGPELVVGVSAVVHQNADAAFAAWVVAEDRGAAINRELHGDGSPVDVATLVHGQHDEVVIGARAGLTLSILSAEYVRALAIHEVGS